MKNKFSINQIPFIYVIFLLLAVIFCSCEIPTNKTGYTNTVKEFDNGTYYVKEIDSCEYVISLVYGGRSICHKGNCKFCAERSKK
jgi:hypothetical protein